jgi:hypothetical protein
MMKTKKWKNGLGNKNGFFLACGLPALSVLPYTSSSLKNEERIAL